MFFSFLFLYQVSKSKPEAGRRVQTAELLVLLERRDRRRRLLLASNAIIIKSRSVMVRTTMMGPAKDKRSFVKTLHQRWKVTIITTRPPKRRTGNPLPATITKAPQPRNATPWSSSRRRTNIPIAEGRHVRNPPISAIKTITSTVKKGKQKELLLFPP